MERFSSRSQDEGGAWFGTGNGGAELGGGAFGDWDVDAELHGDF